LILGSVLCAPDAVAQEATILGSNYHPGTQLIDVSLGYGRWLNQSASSGAYGFGAGYHYFLTSVVSVGLDVSADQLGKVQPSNGGEEFDFQAISLSTQLTFNGRGRTVSPYVAAGAGPYILHTETEGEQRLTPRWGFSGRAGVRVVGMRPVLGVDAKYALVLLNPENDIGVAQGESATSFLSFRATLSWSF
jgi:hypothetical protein